MLKILAIGDSHTKYFRLTNQVVVAHPPVRGVTCIAKVIHGATITGVGKLESTLNVGSDIPKWIESAKPDFMVLNLGQVDIELGLPFRKFVKGDETGMQDHMTAFVEAYAKYLVGLDFPAKRVVIKGINLPVLCYDRGKAVNYINRIVTERFSDSLSDTERRAEVLAKLKADYPSDIVRTDLAHRFNDMLRTAATEAGYSYFDLNAELADPVTGLIKSAYVPAGMDHHLADSIDVRALHWQALLPVLRKQLWA